MTDYKRLWEKCMDDYKLKKLEEQYITRNIKAQDFIDSRLMLTFGEILREMNIAQPVNIEELEEQYRNIITNQATERGAAANAIGLVIQRFVEEQKKKSGGKRKKKTRRRRGGMNSPNSIQMVPNNAPQHIPPLILIPTVSVLHANFPDQTPESIFQVNMGQELVGEENINEILRILNLYLTDYSQRVSSGDFESNINFLTFLTNDRNAFRYYIDNQQGGKRRKKKTRKKRKKTRKKRKKTRKKRKKTRKKRIK